MIIDSIRAGRPYPDAIANAPSLEPHEVFYFNAYQELSTCRQTELGLIPWTAIREYAHEYGTSIDDLVTIILLIDVEVTKEAAKTRKTKGASADNDKHLGKSRQMARKDRGQS